MIPDCYVGSRGVTQHYGKYDSPDDAAGDNACEHSQLSFEPCVHAAHPRLAADYTRTPSASLTDSGTAPAEMILDFPGHRSKMRFA